MNIGGTTVMKKLLLILLILSLPSITNNEIKQTVITTADEEDGEEYYNEDVEIIKVDKEKYHEGVEFSKDFFILNQNFDYNVEKVLSVNEHDYYIIGSIYNGNHPYETENLQEFPYIAYYENETLLWEKILDDWGYGKIRDAIIDDDYLVITGNYEMKTTKNMIVVAKFSQNGGLKDKIDFYGNGNSYGYRVFDYQDKYYFIGTTYANDGHFLSNDGNNLDIVAGFVSKDNFNEYQLNLYGNNGNNIFYDAQMLDGKLYAYLRFCGEGYFSSPLGKDFQAILVIDEFLEYTDYLSIEEYPIKELSKMKISDDKLVIISNNYWDYSLLFTTFDKELNFIGSRKINVCSDNSRFTNFKISFSDYITIALDIKNGNKYYKQINILNYNLENIYSRRINSFSGDKITDVYLINRLVYIGGSHSKGSIFSPYLESYVNIKIEETAISLNGIYVAGKALAPEKELMDFGTYERLYEFSCGDYTFVIPIIKEIPLIVNIDNKGVYDINVPLYFNGSGYLNNERIESGYCCPNEGTYLLEIIGNNEKSYLTFSVRKMAIDIGDITDELAVDIKFYGETEDTSSGEKTTLNLVSPKAVDDDYNIYISLVLGLLGIAIGFFLPFRRK